MRYGQDLAVSRAQPLRRWVRRSTWGLQVENRQPVHPRLRVFPWPAGSFTVSDCRNPASPGSAGAALSIARKRHRKLRVCTGRAENIASFLFEEGECWRHQVGSAATFLVLLAVFLVHSATSFTPERSHPATYRGCEPGSSDTRRFGTGQHTGSKRDHRARRFSCDSKGGNR